MPSPIARSARFPSAAAAPLPIVSPARTFPDLAARGLIGISDAVVRDHLELYGRYVAELAAIDAARPPAWRQPAIPSMEMQVMLAAPVRELPLTIEGQLAEAVAQVEAELQAKGISWRPLWYLGDADFWTTDQAISINLPWYLANEQLWELVNEQDARLSREDVVGILRHELGHALGYAYELWKLGQWKVTFGDFFQPYLDEYVPDPASTDFVRHLHDAHAAPNAHYAQKHPDEDWAETFAVWLDPGSRWVEDYAGWPGALGKLEAVQSMLVGAGAAYGPPINRRVGRTVDYRTLDYTVGEYLGQGAGGPDPADDRARRAPTVYDAVVLHELHFEALARGSGVTGPGPRFAELAWLAFGAFDAWAADFRATARASTGWALTCYDRRDGRLRNVLVDGHDRGVPANADVLIALDCFEHAWVGDMPATRKDVYVAAFFRNLMWGVIEARTLRASPPIAVMTTLTLRSEAWPPLDLPSGATGTVER